MTIYDAIIIGAGPAGAMAACELASVGDILLIDKSAFPRPKVCGCCLNGAALDQLQQVGLLDSIKSEAVLLKSLKLFVEGNCIEIEMPHSLSLSRERFDQMLVLEAQRRGVLFKQNCTALVQSSTNGDRRIVQLTDESGAVETATGRVVIVADGLGGTALQHFPELALLPDPRSKVGVGTRLASTPLYKSGTIYMSYGRQGYAGIVRLEDGTFDLAAALDLKNLRSDHDVAHTVEQILLQAGAPLITDLHQLRWRGTKPLTCRRKDVATERIFVIGDSASYVEPFTGEGIAWALASARVLAPIVQRGLHNHSRLVAAEWRYMHRRVIRRRQSTSSLVAWLLRQHELSGAAAALLRRVPLAAQPMVHQLNARIEVV